MNALRKYVFKGIIELAYSIFKQENKTIWFQKLLKNGSSNIIEFYNKIS